MAVFGAACSANTDGDAPPPIVDDGEEAELRALEIGDDEPIVDEGDPDVGRLDPEENPLADDEEDVPEVDVGTLGPQVTNRQIAGSEKRVSVSGKTYHCRPAMRDCVCQGSPLNCEMPNTQPGRNRYLPPAFVAEMDRRTNDREKVLDAGRWEVKPGTVLYDGTGRQRGAFTSQCFTWAAPTGDALAKVDGVCAKINFGQMKRMQGAGDAAPRPYVYAFNVFIGGTLDSSGWIPLDDVVQKAELVKMGSHAPRRVRSFVSTKYVIKSARDWGQTPETFASDRLPAWAQSKVAPGPGSRKVRDYLLRDGNLINLAYGTPRVGGAATDTFYVADAALGFKRVRSTTRRPTLVRVPVDDRSRPTLIFAYGSIEGRFGWVAIPAFRRGEVRANAAAAPADSCAGKADGVYCSAAATDAGYFCRGGVLTTVKCQGGQRCVGGSPDGQVLQCAQ